MLLGVGCGIEPDIIDPIEAGVSQSVDTREYTDDYFLYGSYQNDYGQSLWPHLRPYAIAKNVTDADAMLHAGLFAILDNDNNLNLDNDNIGQYLPFFYFYPTRLPLPEEP